MMAQEVNGTLDGDIRDFIEAAGLPRGDLHELPTSAKRFPDGASYRIEIPSTEGVRCLDAVLDEASRLEVPVHRVSQGSGGLFLTDQELDEMALLAADAGIEASLFAQPIAGMIASVSARSQAGAAVAGSSHGQDGVVAALEGVGRAADHGFRSVVISDVGLLAAFDAMRSAHYLPSEMQAKVSAGFPVANPSTALVLVKLGANTLNLVTDLTLAQIAAIRAAVDVPIDLYVEAPDSMGGFTRLHELPELVRVGAPVYVKLGVMNARDIYPSGMHLEGVAIALSRERVRRARLAVEVLGRSDLAATTSAPRAPGLAVPARNAATSG